MKKDNLTKLGLNSADYVYLGSEPKIQIRNQSNDNFMSMSLDRVDIFKSLNNGHRITLFNGEKYTLVTNDNTREYKPEVTK